MWREKIRFNDVICTFVTTTVHYWTMCAAAVCFMNYLSLAVVVVGPVDGFGLRAAARTRREGRRTCVVVTLGRAAADRCAPGQCVQNRGTDRRRRERRAACRYAVTLRRPTCRTGSPPLVGGGGLLPVGRTRSGGVWWRCVRAAHAERR